MRDVSKRSLGFAVLLLVGGGAVTGCSGSSGDLESLGSTSQDETAAPSREPPLPPLNPRAPLSQDEIDLAGRLLADQPDRLRMLEEPVSDAARPTPDGNYTVDVPGHDGRVVTRTTMGKWFGYRSIISAASRLANPENRVTLYAVLRSTTTLRDTPTVDAARMLSNDELDALIDKLVAVATQPGAIALKNPPPPPHACSSETGTGLGKDSTVNCQPQSTFIKDIAYTLKNDLSCVRDQGNRGTCAAFAITGAVETSWRVKHNGNFLNLSEQGLYARATHGWNNTDYGDGLDEVDTLQRMISHAYRFAWESSWDYNASPNRTDSGTSYTHSCDNYVEKCSNTTHQLPSSSGSWVDTTVSSSAVGVSSLVAIDLNPQKDHMALVTALLATKIPIILDVMADGALTHPDGNNYVDWYGAVPVGAHALMLVGTVTVGELKTYGAGAPPYPYNAMPDSYRIFIIRNSWGCDWADNGYALVSPQWMKARTYSMTAVIAN